MKPAVNVQVRGLAEAKAAIQAFGQEVADAVGNAVQATALEATSNIKRAIQRPPKTGREYTRGNKTHRASAPGQAPATDTGALVNSIYFRWANVDSDDFTAAIGSRLDYAFNLEFGTRKMAARPAWVPAVEKAAPRLEKRLRRVIAEAKARAERATK